MKEAGQRHFYNEIFSKIDEKRYKVLYSEKKNRPNKPVNVPLVLWIIKQFFGSTDKELINQYYNNFKVMAALRVGGIGRETISLRVVLFRRRSDTMNRVNGLI